MSLLMQLVTSAWKALPLSITLTVGLTVEGLFRVSPLQSALQCAIAAYDRGHPVDLRDYGPHVAASLIKQFMTMLPMPIFPAHIYSALSKFPTIPEDNRTQYIRQHVLERLDPCSVILLSSIMTLLDGSPLQILYVNIRCCYCCVADKNVAVKSFNRNSSHAPPSST